MNSSSASGTASQTAAHAVNRTRSVRKGPPLSARAAAVRKGATPESAAAEEEAKAEQHAKMEELQHRLHEQERQYGESQKHAAVLQLQLDEARKEQGMLEERCGEQAERINDLENDKKESVRARREMEQIYESERAAAIKEQEATARREDDMKSSLQRMKETLAHREWRAGVDDDRRPLLSRHSSNGPSTQPSPNPDSTDRQFAPSSVHRSDSASRNISALVNQKDKIIEGLRLELAEAQIKLVEADHMRGGRTQEMQSQLYEVKMQNARLMEENESFQLLLSEKTLSGDFLRLPSVEPASYDGSRPPSRNPGAGERAGTTLADELESHADSEGGEDTRRLQAEVNSLKDQNKALTLYINNIISRLLQHEQFEQILDKTPDLMAGPGAISKKYQDVDKELPAPPKDDGEQPSLLQRAKSVIGGRPTRPRPLSQLVQPEQMEATQRTLGVIEDPQTAPSVPLGRARSTRGHGGHRRANSEWPAASVVTNMYRGPQQNMGPLSPGLTSPTGRNSFFANRAPSSGSGVPTISETASQKDNVQRDSKFSSQSNRNSVISNPAGSGIDDEASAVSSNIYTERSNQSSPPRSTSSTGADKDKQSGAIMMGSKPRPLRLVQEAAAADDDAARKQANRGSWFGWMNKGGMPPPGTAPGASAGGATLGEKLGTVFGKKNENESGASQ